jgi:hypothetical protein
MKIRALRIAIAVLGVICCGATLAYSAAGTVKIIQQDLPNANVIAVGKGYVPSKQISNPQKRLLAQRAATVDAYRALASAINGISGYVANGTGYLNTSGYVKGAQVQDVRYYTSGKVEVEVVAPVVLNSRTVQGKVSWDATVDGIAKEGYPIYYSERPAKQISEEEWLVMAGK